MLSYYAFPTRYCPETVQGAMIIQILALISCSQVFLSSTRHYVARVDSLICVILDEKIVYLIFPTNNTMLSDTCFFSASTNRNAECSKVGFIGLGNMGRPMAENLINKVGIFGYTAPLSVLSASRTGIVNQLLQLFFCTAGFISGCFVFHAAYWLATVDE